MYCVLCVDSARKAEAVFDGVLKCKVRADATRNALLVLQRYRFLFSLPRSIEKNIKNVSQYAFIVWNLVDKTYLRLLYNRENMI